MKVQWKLISKIDEVSDKWRMCFATFMIEVKFNHTADFNILQQLLINNSVPLNLQNRKYTSYIPKYLIQTWDPDIVKDFQGPET